MDDLYREQHPRSLQEPAQQRAPRAPSVEAEGSIPLCGDELRVELQVTDGVVEDVRYNGRGCAISQAAASMLSDAVKGRQVEDVERMGKEDVLEELGIPLTPIRLKCALLSVGVLKVALAELKGESIPAEWAADNEITWKSAVGPATRSPRAG